MKSYEIGKQWSAGFAASLLPSARLLSESDHWLAGWDAGYAFRKAKNERLNEYMVSIGEKPFGVVKLCEAAPPSPE
mgnify:CR=1 FL=1